MDLKEKIDVCLTCKNRKHDNSGVVCGLTGEKPAFQYHCFDYDKDEEAVARVGNNRRTRKEKEVWENRSLPIGESQPLPGSSWFRTIGALSIINVVLSFLGVVFLFGLGSTQYLQCLAEWGLISKVSGYIVVVAIPMFFLWTWMLTSRGYIYPYIVGLCIYGLDALISVILLSIGFDITLIIDVIFHFVLLIYLIVKLSSRATRELKVPFEWGAHKVVYTIMTALLALVMIVTLFSTAFIDMGY